MAKTKTFKEDDYVKCPYYRKESATEIKCSGLVGTWTASIFESRAKKDHYKMNFCTSNCYLGCPLCQSLMEDDK